MPSWSRWRSSAMIVAIAYNPNFALMVTFGLSPADVHRARDARFRHFLVLMGGTAAGVLTLSEVRTRTKLIKVGATAAVGLLPHDLGHRACGRTSRSTWSRSDSLWRAGWGLMAGFFLGGSLPFVENALRDRHRDQPARAGRHHPPAAPGAGPPGPGHAQPLDHRRRDRRGGGRADRRRCPARAHRGLFPRHRQDAQAALLRREPGRRRPTATPSSRRR